MLRIPRAWLIPRADERAEEEAYVTSFAFDTIVDAFPLGNGLIGLHVSSYATADEGSARAAAGRDVFLIVQPGAGKVTRGLTGLGITKDRVRWMGCPIAHASHFLIADINGDGIIDIGRIAEQLDCDYLRDSSGAVAEPRSGPYYSQSAIHWYVFSRDRWVLQSAFDGRLPESYRELPLIGASMNPVDVFAEYRWHSYDPSRWDSRGIEPRFIPAYRRKLIEQEAPSPH